MHRLRRWWLPVFAATGLLAGTGIGMLISKPRATGWSGWIGATGTAVGALASVLAVIFAVAALIVQQRGVREQREEQTRQAQDERLKAARLVTVTATPGSGEVAGPGNARSLNGVQVGLRNQGPSPAYWVEVRHTDYHPDWILAAEQLFLGLTTSLKLNTKPFEYPDTDDGRRQIAAGVQIRCVLDGRSWLRHYTADPQPNDSA